jgi:hypothetical protein
MRKAFLLQIYILRGDNAPRKPTAKGLFRRRAIWSRSPEKGPMQARLSSHSGSAFKLTVSDMQSTAAPIEPMLRAALTNCLIRLEQRVRISSSRKPVYLLEAIVRNTPRSRCQAVALFEQLRKVGVRKVQWVSVIEAS